MTSSSHATKKVKIKIKMGKTAADEAQLKAIYNGLCLQDSSSSSLGDDETFSHSNAESSPEPSPMSMIQVNLVIHMAALHPNAGGGIMYRHMAPFKRL